VSIQRNAAGIWSLQPANPGYCFGVTPPPPPNTISFTGRDNSDPALPVGFEDQLFATLRSGATNAVIATTFTWSTETPLLASIDANGVLRALGAGTAIVRATAQDGTSTTYSLATRVAVPGGTASYAGNTEFGDPSDGDASDEVIIRRDQYTSSFSPARGIPNWVSYDLEASHFGAEDRCDCFTYDPELPQAQRYTTADYTGAGTAAGYGIDRGHLARSFDRTTGSFDNATTFYFSNIIPQAADNNQGPWAQFENHLGDLARFGNKEVYIIAGASGSKGTVKNEGRITIPAATWKVALVMPRDAGLTSVSGRQDVEVVAVLMPNEPGIRNVPWQTYLTTVDAVESVSGFDLLSLLRDDIEIAVESNTVPPDAVLDGPWAGYAGDPLAMSAAGSTDADGDALTYAWDFGDGSVASGASVAHTFTGAGQYSVRLIATDVRGLADTISSIAAITPLPPAVGIARARAIVDEFARSGTLNGGQANSLRVKLDAASRSIERGNVEAAEGQLNAFLNEVDAMVRSGRLTAPQVAALREVLGRVLDNL
jgi:endonuclease G